MEITMDQWLDTLPEDLIDRLADLPADVVNHLKGANPSQLRAATEIEGPIQINAVAGSGKTFVLTRRIAVMKSKGIKPNNIFCTTFTKKATGEMEERLGKLVPKMYIQNMTIGTTHSIGYRILSKEYRAMGHHLARAFDRNKDILMNTEQKKFMEGVKKDIIKDLSVPIEIKQELNEIVIPQFMRAIGLSKAEGIDNVAYEIMHTGKGNRMDAYILFYNRYEQKKWDEVYVDGDDLLFLLVKLLRENPDILAKYQRIFKYFLVDESQDNNDLQWELIQMLSYPEHNVFVVGDDDQAMYSFRGANPKQFIYFKDRYKNVKQISLEDNYRSNTGILQAANSLIANNSERIIKSLKANRKEALVMPMHTAYEDETAEAKGVVGEINHLMETKEGLKHKQVAILYRTNAQSRAFEDELIMAGLPYVIHGGISFYERAEVKDLVAYLRLVVDPHDDEAYDRIYNKPKRFLGKVYMEKVGKYRGSAWDAVNDSNFISRLTYEKKGVDQYTTLMYKLFSMKEDEECTVSDIIDYICGPGGYEDYIREEGDEEEEGNSRMENIGTLKYVVSKFKKIEEFLDYIKMMTGTAKHDINGVQLMTIHRSKGLEFPVVFNVGLSEGILPHFKSVEDSESGARPLAVEEERRLNYVGVTRAGELCYTSSIGAFNDRKCGRSRFINEMAQFLNMVNNNTNSRKVEQATEEEWDDSDLDSLLDTLDLTEEEYHKMVLQEVRWNRDLLEG